MINFEDTFAFAQFGSGSLCVGIVVDNTGGYYINIRNLTDNTEIGIKPKDESVARDDKVICLWFPTIEQTLRVHSAFTNKSYEEVLAIWNGRETKSWKMVVKVMKDE